MMTLNNRPDLLMRSPVTEKSKWKLTLNFTTPTQLKLRDMLILDSCGIQVPSSGVHQHPYTSSLWKGAHAWPSLNRLPMATASATSCLRTTGISR